MYLNKEVIEEFVLQCLVKEEYVSDIRIKLMKEVSSEFHKIINELVESIEYDCR